ncbi:MAG: hypothetical protein AB1705_22960 [Verrucomicrobiota bacterium]
MKAEFEMVFGRLREILAPYAGRLKVSADVVEHYCLDVEYSEKLKKGYPVAWVKASKAYVSYHFMPVYMFPQLRAGMSEGLKARMQGKSCFNFKAVDEELFQELERVTAEGFALAKKAGLGP